MARISKARQCKLLSIHRSGLYYKPARESSENLQILRLLDERYLKTPFYGKLRLHRWLRDEKGFTINPKRVRRLMQIINWQTIYRKPRSTKPNQSHRVYPYLLRGLTIERANQVWAIDITYVPVKRGFMYLCAVIDLHTRYVLTWSLSNSMSSQWCRSIIDEAIDLYGQPEIINSDQGSQFTSYEHTSLQEKGISISMDGKGRAIDNIFIERLWKSVKYECVYLHAFEDGLQLYNGLSEYFRFYNHQRQHQSLGYKTPAAIYGNAVTNNSNKKQLNWP